VIPQHRKLEVHRHCARKTVRAIIALPIRTKAEFEVDSHLMIDP